MANKTSIFNQEELELIEYMNYLHKQEQERIERMEQDYYNSLVETGNTVELERLFNELLLFIEEENKRNEQQLNKMLNELK